MSKLYATLETSRGKVVSVSDNEQIIATVYEGNKKAYGVTIEWCVVGDPDHVKCNKCEWLGDEEDLEIIDDMRACPTCKTDECLTDVPAVMGAIVSSREWRNETDERRIAQRKA